MTHPDHSSPPIVLTTDFGLSDAFVGVMKGVILGINPRATIIDLTHEIGPQDLRCGAFVLGVNHSYFPAGTIHVAVVDPGVGTDRKALVLETPTARFVAPDNGLLSQVLAGYLSHPPASCSLPMKLTLPPPLQAYELTNPQYRLERVGNTFHGRDIFAPAAAHLSLGVRPSKMGPALTQLTYHPLPEPATTTGQVTGEVLYVDRYGNLVTNIPESAIENLRREGKPVIVTIGRRSIFGLSKTFHDRGDIPAGRGKSQGMGPALVALVGSCGYLEIAVPDGNAAHALGLSVGALVRLNLAS